MDIKKLNALISKELKRAGKDYKREKARCKKMYPDWEDNELNMLDNLFIWGYTPDANATPSFYTWDDALVYFNRVTKKYYMTIDTGFYGYEKEYNAELARDELYRLTQIENAFRNFLGEKGESLYPGVFPLLDPTLEGDTLGELYTKFRIMLNGYEMYCKYQELRGNDLPSLEF